MPDDTILIDEAITAGPQLFEQTTHARRDVSGTSARDGHDPEEVEHTGADRGRVTRTPVARNRLFPKDW